LVVSGESYPMPGPLIDTPEALDAAIKTNAQLRREALLRAARGEGQAFRMSEILAGLVVLCACGELIVEPKRAGYAAFIACLSVAWVYIGRRARQKEAVRKLQEMGDH
jgi:urea transporter